MTGVGSPESRAAALFLMAARTLFERAQEAARPHPDVLNVLMATDEDLALAGRVSGKAGAAMAAELGLR